MRARGASKAKTRDCIYCTLQSDRRRPNLFHSAGKYQRDPPSSKDALPCDQSDGNEKPWLLLGIPFVSYRKSKKGFIEHEDIFPFIIHLKPITPLQNSLLNPPFNFDSKYKFKDIDDQVQDDSKETIYPELNYPIQQAAGRPKARKLNARYDPFSDSYLFIKFKSPINTHLEH
ncbi:uncharacterized protein Bfra_007886 [Botrytis fragariae]|uniref:Uncharacterized protein n=1 Tax=Botrytis fragariae TaxID=1964551 RepID=A0A8H6APV3_9HELO|nr:uncharacterized protein Bfra_007886 [Botrytis fragariae]KAF5871371.1 hypothetical protein Bfra_007886 [Botrytis fragariae]